MTGPRADPKAPSGSLLVPPLYACLPQQLAVLLLGHSLAALLDDGAHSTTPRSTFWDQQACLRTPDTRRLGHTPTFLHANGLDYRAGRAASARGGGREDAGTPGHAR
jgi:hypothetical protein